MSSTIESLQKKRNDQPHSMFAARRIKLERDIMDKEHVKGEAKKVEGNIKEAAGKATDDKSLEAEGKVEQAEGEARRKAGDVKDAVDN